MKKSKLVTHTMSKKEIIRDLNFLFKINKNKIKKNFYLN
jgi:hypothetical protein